MSTVVISDLHLCDRGSRDNFIVRGEERFLRFLDWVETNDHNLIVAGDLFEWWQCNIGTSILAYEKITDRLDLLNTEYIFGNHDNAFAALPFRMVPDFTLIREGHGPIKQTINGKKFLFCHGHEGDDTCSTLNPGVGYITAIISGLMEDRAKSPYYKGSVIEDRFIGALEHVLNTWRFLSLGLSRRDTLINGVEQYRKDQEADVIISGHSHEPGRIGTYHYNAGCWCRDKDTFVQVNDDGEVQLFVWDGTQPVPFDKELL